VTSIDEVGSINWVGDLLPFTATEEELAMKRMGVVLLVIAWVLVSVPATAGDGEGDRPEFLAMSHQVGATWTGVGI